MKESSIVETGPNEDEIARRERLWYTSSGKRFLDCESCLARRVIGLKFR